MSLMGQAITEMGKGKSLLDVVEDIAPEMARIEKEKQDQATSGQPQLPGAQDVPEDQAASDAQSGFAAGAGAITPDFAPDPLQQQIVRNPVV